jgi:hypothetical protein
MTTYFQGEVLGSNKPLRSAPGTHSSLMNQEKALLEHEKFPQKNSTTLLLKDRKISPETTGITNTTKAKPQSSARNTFQINQEKQKNSSSKMFTNENYNQYTLIIRRKQQQITRKS